MPRHLLYLIVFIEGFCSLGAEVIALRRLVPHVGSAIVVTAPTIGLFLLALALGYAAGARVADCFTAVVGRNFVVSALLAGVGLSRLAVDGLFGAVQPVWLAYLLFMGLVLCPLAWLLGQTVPVLTNLMKHMRTGEASGMALYWSTLGSFLGSVSLSLLVMQWLGVSAAVLVCAVWLLAGSLLLAPRNLSAWPAWAQALAAACQAIAALPDSCWLRASSCYRSAPVGGGGPDYLPMLQRELLEVIRKYVNVDAESVKVDLIGEGDNKVLDISVALPENPDPAQA